MNETIHPYSPSDLAWPNGEPRVRVPDTSMLPAGEKAAPAAAGLVQSAAQGAHDTVDRLAASSESLHAKADQLRAKGDEWADGVRDMVRSRPLAAVAAAVALGAVIARIAR